MKQNNKYLFKKPVKYCLPENIYPYEYKYR